MIITREVDYALRLLRSLSSGEKMSVRELCDREQIPQQFTYKIIRKLARDKYINVTRGVDGGCCLRADLSELSLYDLMETMDARSYVNGCLSPGFHCSWAESCSTGCRLHRQLEKIQANLDQELKTHSLKGLIQGE